MDEKALQAAEAELIAWGLLERGPQGPAWTRRFRGAVMRAAGTLAEMERGGQKPEGAPLVNSVRHALQAWDWQDGQAATRLHEQLLVAVELAALPEGVRDFFA